MRRHKGSKFQQTVVSAVGSVELRNVKVVKPAGCYWATYDDACVV